MKKLFKRFLLGASALLLASVSQAAIIRYVQISTNSLTRQTGTEVVAGANISTATISSATITNASITNQTINNFTATQSTITTLTSTDFIGTRSTITTLSNTDFTSTRSTITNLNSTTSNLTTANITNANVTNLTIASINISSGAIGYFNTSSMTVSGQIGTGPGLTAGTSGQFLLSRGPNVSPYWGGQTWRRPNLVYISGTQIDVENNTATANETCIQFRDGEIRCVTENTSSTDQYRRFVVTSTASFAAGSTEDSGMRNTFPRTANTTYCMFAVKSSSDATKYVLVGDSMTFIPTNYSTLDTRYGTGSYAYIGSFKVGDNSGSTTAILKFRQTGAITRLVNNVTGSALNGQGVRLANTAGAASLTYTYSAGSGATNIQDNFTTVCYMASGLTVGTRVQDSSGTNFKHVLADSSQEAIAMYWDDAAEGVKTTPNSGSPAQSIYLCGWIDAGLGVSWNP